MRKNILLIALAVAATLASAGDVLAQRWGGGRGGGWGGGRGGVSINLGGGSYNRGYYPGGYGWGYGYGNPYNRGFYSPYYGARYYSNYGYSPGYYYSTPSYYSVAPAQYSYVPSVTESFYSGPESNQQSAMVRVLVPTQDAEVWFGNNPTKQQGLERFFSTPELSAGQSYSYTVRARWMENGKAVDRERQVSVQPGETATVDFRVN